MKIGVTGATGFVGQRLVELAIGDGDEVVAFTRSSSSTAGRLPSVDALSVREWDYGSGPPPAGTFAELDAVIHLAGENVAGGRWTAKRKQRIRDSRVNSTRHVVDGIEQESASDRPALISASAIGFYGPRGDEDVTESDGAGNDFLADVCVAWEKEAQRAADLGVREARVRVGVVLGHGGGALVPLVRAFKLFAGGPMGNGRQWMSWVHLEDVARLFLHAARQSDVAGALNGTAPEPERNRDLARALGKALRRPSFLPAPGFGLRLLIGEFAEVLLSGQRVLPKRTVESGFTFGYPQLTAALAELFR